MITQIKGRCIHLQPNVAWIEVHGIVYEVYISLNTYKVLQQQPETPLYTALFLQPNQIRLVGFTTVEEKQVFLWLLKVGGIGIDKALTLLSGFSVNELVRCIERGDVDRLAALKGIGKRVAQRIIVELRGIIPKVIAEEQPSMERDAIQALQQLGIAPKEAEKRVKKALKKRPKDLEHLIRLALRGDL